MDDGVAEVLRACTRRKRSVGDEIVPGTPNLLSARHGRNRSIVSIQRRNHPLSTPRGVRMSIVRAPSFSSPAGVKA